MIRTLYELAAIRGADRYLIGYCDRKTRRMLLDVCYQHAEAINRLAGTDTLNFCKRAADGATVGDVAIRFTGRTKLDAKQMGELPRLSSLIATWDALKGVSA